MKRAILLLLLTGCATNSDFVWTKTGGVDGQTFYMDQGQCRAQAFGVANVTPLQAALVFDSCMQGRGYYKQSVPRAGTY